MENVQREPVDLVEEAPLHARLSAYVGARVTVYYQNGYNDTGTIAYMDATWVELIKDNGEQFLIPIVAIRIVKLLESSRQKQEASTLLRPAGVPSPDEPRKGSR